MTSCKNIELVFSSFLLLQECVVGTKSLYLVVACHTL